eukprot:2323793-Pleurochrysis_carterae.AAC.6
MFIAPGEHGANPPCHEFRAISLVGQFTGHSPLMELMPRHGSLDRLQLELGRINRRGEAVMDPLTIIGLQGLGQCVGRGKP